MNYGFHREFNSEHRIFVGPSILKNQSADQFTAGNRAYVTGRIKYKEIASAESRSENSAHIQSHTILLCAKDEDSSNGNFDAVYKFICFKMALAHINGWKPLPFQIPMK